MTTKISSDNIQAATLATLGSGPTVTNVQITDSSYNVLDDTAVGTSGGYIKITGTNFASGCSVIINSTNATSVTFVSSTVLNVQVPAMAAGTYIVYVVNTDGGIAIRVNGLTYSGTPSWVTGSTLPQGSINSAINIQLSATSDSTITYALQAGSSLPTGLTLSSSGLLSGTITGLSAETTYNFTITATDVELQDSPRSFSITITVGDQYWNYVSTLLSASAPTIMPFNADASTNNFAVTINGDTKPNNLSPFTAGYSNFFNGSTDYLTYPYNAALLPGSGDFTVEAWSYVTSTTASGTLVGVWKGTAGEAWQIIANGNVVILGLNSTLSVNTPNGSAPINQWNHIAWVKSGSTNTVYINGVSVATLTAATINNSTDGVTIGTNIDAIGVTAWQYPGYISNLRIVKGVAVYTSNFTPSTIPLTAISGTSLLTCKSNSGFQDLSTNNLSPTRFGTLSISSFYPVSNPIGASTYFDGSGDSLSVPSNAAFAMGTGDFTVECWIYYIVGGSGGRFIVDSNNGGNLLFRYNVGTTLEFYANSSLKLSYAVSLANAWNHVAVTRSGSTYRLFLNGALVSTGSGAENISSTANFTIGSRSGNSSSDNFSGYISNLRVIKGTAVYTATFTPPIVPLTAITNTVLLTCQTNQPVNNNVFLDNSTNNFLVTKSGNATQGTFSPYGENWSNYFDGGTNRLTTGTSSLFNLAGANFTVECWVYMTSAPSVYNRLITIGPNAVQSSLSFGMTTGRVFDVGVPFSSGGSVNSGSTLIPLNTWTHLAFVLNGSTGTIFINGTQVGQTTGWSLTSSTTNYFYLGYDSTATVDGKFTGYISNVRLVVGTAVYTGAFTPSTTPLQPIANTRILTCQSPIIVDDSANKFALSITGSLPIQKFGPFAATTLPTPYYSNSFDGSTGKLIFSTSTAMYLDGQFTIECWVNWSGTTLSYQNFIGSNNTFTSNASFFRVWGSGFATLGSKVGIGNPTHDGASSVYSTTSLQPNIWYHVAATRDSSNIIRVFVNGVLERTGSTDTSVYDFGQGGTCIGNSPWNGAQGWFKGAISNLRVLKGTCLYTTTFTPPTSTLTSISNTSLLTCQSSTLIDNSTNNFTITSTGSAFPAMISPFTLTYSTKQSYTPSVYGGSMYFDGTGDYLTTQSSPLLSLGSDNFTMEFWFYASPKVTQYPILISNGNFGAGKWQLTDRHQNYPTKICFGAYNALNAPNFLESVTTVSIGNWYHVAITRVGSTFTMYVNGIAEDTGTYASAIDSGTQTVYVGQDQGQTVTLYAGYISDVRVTKGQSLYNANFVPSNKPLTAVQNSVLLLNGASAGIYDSSEMNNFETVGDAKLSTQVVKYGNTSMYFDGTGDNVTARNTIPIGSGNFTVEFWVYPLSNSNTSFPGMFDCRNAGSDTNGFGLYYNGGSTFVLRIGGDNFASSQTVALNQWSHVALCRVGTTMTCYINGISRISTTSSADFNRTVHYVGSTFDNYGLQGYIQDVRITRGVARYTANFTPPDTAFQRK